MAVHRVGPPPNNQPARESLGRVLVTIDDLEALVQLLKDRAADPSSVRIRFSGGWIDESKDLRSLTDAELVSLTVESDALEVELSTRATTAIGAPAHVQDINNLWARARQTTDGLKPELSLASRASLGVAGALFIFVLLMLFIPGVRTPIPENVRALIVLLVMIFVVISTFFSAGAYKAEQIRAVIKPVSLDEYRQMRANNQYPRAAWIVAVVSAAIAALAIVATLVVPLLSTP